MTALHRAAAEAHGGRRFAPGLEVAVSRVGAARFDHGLWKEGYRRDGRRPLHWIDLVDGTPVVPRRTDQTPGTAGRRPPFPDPADAGLVVSLIAANALDESFLPLIHPLDA